MDGLHHLWHRVLGMVRVASVTLVDDTNQSGQTHQLAFSPRETWDDVPALNNYGFTSNPLPGAKAVSLTAHGDQSKGVVIAVGDGRYRLSGTQSGEVAIHDDLGQAVYLTRTGIVIRAASKPVRLEGDLHVTGDVLASCDNLPRSMLQHVHDEVAPGGGKTGVPVPGT